jgi:hypothetical protein
MEKKKLKIQDLKVQSFVTALDNHDKQTVMGGNQTNGAVCDTKVAGCQNTVAAICNTNANACVVVTAVQLCGTCQMSTCAITIICEPTLIC